MKHKQRDRQFSLPDQTVLAWENDSLHDIIAVGDYGTNLKRWESLFQSTTAKV